MVAAHAPRMVVDKAALVLEVLSSATGPLQVGFNPRLGFWECQNRGENLGLGAWGYGLGLGARVWGFYWISGALPTQASRLPKGGLVAGLPAACAVVPSRHPVYRIV
jgi:hypothetical protein